MIDVYKTAIMIFPTVIKINVIYSTLHVNALRVK